MILVGKKHVSWKTERTNSENWGRFLPSRHGLTFTALCKWRLNKWNCIIPPNIPPIRFWSRDFQCSCWTQAQLGMNMSDQMNKQWLNLVTPRVFHVAAKTSKVVWPQMVYVKSSNSRFSTVSFLQLETPLSCSSSWALILTSCPSSDPCDGTTQNTTHKNALESPSSSWSRLTINRSWVHEHERSF